MVKGNMLSDGVAPRKPSSPKTPAPAPKPQSFTSSPNGVMPPLRGGLAAPNYVSADAKTGVPFSPGAGQTPPSGGGGGGGMVPFSGGGGMSPMVAPPSEEDYLAGDGAYQTQLSALQGALQRYLADSDFQRTNYQTDYNQSLRDLGYDEGAKAWNWDDKLTASGRGYQNQLDDFGSRGMLQSSGYADAYQELQRMLGQQYESVQGAKTNFMTDMDNQTANFKGENTANQQAARAEAINRRQAQYSL